MWEQLEEWVAFVNVVLVERLRELPGGCSGGGGGGVGVVIVLASAKHINGLQASLQ